MERVKFTFGGVFGGIVDPNFDNKNTRKAHGFESRYTVTLSDLFERYNVPKVIDYLSLDVDGAESFIMRDFPFEHYKLKIMTVERPKEDLKDLLTRNGYVFVKQMVSWGEMMYCHESFLSRFDFHPQESIHQAKYLRDTRYDYK